MEKFSFHELVALAKEFYVDYGSLITDDSTGSLITQTGIVLSKDDDYDRIMHSDRQYDKLSAFIKILKDILEHRPLPF